jgi:hypothetical protein
MMKLRSSHSPAGLSLTGAPRALAADARRVIGEAAGDRQAVGDPAERIHRLKHRAPGHPSAEVRRWLDRLGQQVRTCWHHLGREGRAPAGRGPGRDHRQGEAAVLGLLWRWEWRGELAGGAVDISSRITPPVACCPDCRRELGVAPERSRAVYRPAWPAIYTCPCGFFKGFRQHPQEIRAMVYREIDRGARIALESEPLGKEADFEWDR